MQKFIQAFTVPEIRKKLFVVLGILLTYRLFAAIPIPGVDVERLRFFFSSNQFFGFLNLFSGGGLEKLSVAMLGVGPYITATIIMQLLTIIFPRLKELYYESGAQGRAKFNQYSRLITVPLALVQSYGFLNLLIARGVIDRPPFLELLTNVLVITAGSMVALWLGELITEQKVGNGISLIIVAGIIASLPTTIKSAVAAYTPSVLPSYIGFSVIGLLLILGIVYLNEGERKIPITYARRVRGTKMFGGVSTYLPLKVNQAGMIPLIFAISVLLFPQFIAQAVALVSPGLSSRLTDAVARFSNNQISYGIVYFILVVAFTFFYTAITFNPEEVAKNLQRSGGFIPGIRPGENTQIFFLRLINRITLSGAVSLGLIAVVPIIIQRFTGIAALNIRGTALLILVAVALETMRQINSQLTVRGYEGFE